MPADEMKGLMVEKIFKPTPGYKVEKDILYCRSTECDPVLNSLDVYFDPKQIVSQKKPIVVFVHGGGWDAGDKGCFGKHPDNSLPGWFVKRGYVFASVNYRLMGKLELPQLKVADMVCDIAKAIRWLTIYGRRFGGRSEALVLMGYSSGAHLATLTATNERLLRAHHIDQKYLCAVVALDVPHYDVPLAMRILETEKMVIPDQTRRLASLYSLFGADRSSQERVSPTTGIGPWLKGTAFLLVSSELQLGQRQFLTKRMSEHFKNILAGQGVTTVHRHLSQWDHVELITRWQGELSEYTEDFLKQFVISRGTDNRS